MINGTKVYFRYISCDKDAERYQGRSMDWIGVDELCKMSQYSLQVLLSCLRSPKGFPPRFRGTGNPGGIGHSHVKQRYVEATDYGKKIIIDPETGNRIQFIAATVYDNYVLMMNDPAYARRLENLPLDQKKAFLYGDWDIFAGQFYPEFRRDLHVISSFKPPTWWNKFRSMDYGMDMLACYWWAVDSHGKCHIYRELYESGLSLGRAALKIVEATPEDERIGYTVCSPDLFVKNRDKDTGETEAETMMKAGLTGLIPADNRRVPGWRRVRELLAPYDVDEDDNIIKLPPLVAITEDCPNLIRTLPAINHDEKNVEDVCDEPHELTHAPESFRYGAMSRPQRAVTEEEKKERAKKRRERTKPRNRITGT
jgi:phage terminase large subunit